MPKDIATMSPKITQDGKYVVLTEYNCEDNAIKVCESQTGQLISTIAVTTISFKVSALGTPPTGTFNERIFHKIRLKYVNFSTNSN